MAVTGIRERKKAQTRETIALAAVRLTSERGLSGVTGDDIAEAAQVARRTFRNYFPSKEAAILHAVDTFVMRYVELVQLRDSNEPILDTLRAAAVDLVESPSMVTRVLVVRSLSRANPTLRVRWAATRTNISLTELVDEIASRTSTDPDIDVYPRVVAQCAWGTIAAAMEMQSDAADDLLDLAERIRNGFAALARGLAPRVTDS